MCVINLAGELKLVNDSNNVNDYYNPVSES